jgi:hypothetical protein
MAVRARWGLEGLDDPSVDGDERAATLVGKRLGTVEPDGLDRLGGERGLIRRRPKGIGIHTCFQ